MARTWQCFGPENTVYSRAIIQSEVDLELSTLRNLQRSGMGKSCKNFQWKTDIAQILPGDLQTSLRTWLEATYVVGTILNVNGGWLAR